MRYMLHPAVGWQAWGAPGGKGMFAPLSWSWGSSSGCAQSVLIILNPPQYGTNFPELYAYKCSINNNFPQVTSVTTLFCEGLIC